jgi:hypothetical protein
MTPRRIETSLVVAEDFRDNTGGAWERGDRAPLARRAVREAATERPQRFRVEFETLELDPEEPWFLEVVARYDDEYAQVKRRRTEEEAERQAALRQEMKQQGKGPARPGAPLQAAGERTRGAEEAGRRGTRTAPARERARASGRRIHPQRIPLRHLGRNTWQRKQRSPTGCKPGRPQG